MGIAEQLVTENDLDVSDLLLISADSHVSEPEDLWQTRLPANLRDQAPTFPRRRAGAGNTQATLNVSRPGGTDPTYRVGEMAQDGVSAEVLFPTLGLRLYAQEDAALQEACFAAYNDWLIEYCSVAPDRLVGVGVEVENGEVRVLSLQGRDSADGNGVLTAQQADILSFQ